jgi:heptosyltransferase II
MSKHDKILIVQTAFPGDVVLTFPLVQVLRMEYPSAQIDMIVIPQTANLTSGHPAISNIIIYDKKGKESGYSGFISKVNQLKAVQYDVAFLPHRSFRSALLATLSKIPIRIGFDKSKAKILYSKKIHYNKVAHEIDRNISLIEGIDLKPVHKELPHLYPSFHDKKKIGLFLSENNIQHANSLIGIAPGSVWMTKRWLEERYIELTERLSAKGYHVLLIGGQQDAELCKRIQSAVPSKHIYNSAGKFSLLQSAELISRCSLIVTNDSAPYHLALAMRTRAVAIFGPTTPDYGFGPYDEIQSVVETSGLSCKPCSIHGGNKCPTGTFDCMKQVSSERVLQEILLSLDKKQPVTD